MTINLWWIRRDLRLQDNPALRAALEGGGSVIPVFILDPELLARSADKRTSFLFSALENLQADLLSRGSRLVLRMGDPTELIPALAREVNAEKVFAIEDYSPYARRRDELVRRQVKLHWISGQTMIHPSIVLTQNGKPYTVFTPFMRAWQSLLPAVRSEWRPPERFPNAPGVEINFQLEDLPGFNRGTPGFPASEPVALERLQNFVSGPIYRYASDRDRMDLDGTSRLSPYLRFGLISPGQAIDAAQRAAELAPDADARKGAETWLREIAWREFYQSILYHFPKVLAESFNAALRGIPWRNNPEELSAWQAGETGYPVVDAAMRQLTETGWMHNRARMIAASFLVKDLLVDWRAGERWFMRHLVDGDPAANNGGWQWTAGVGTDAAPYFRVFNPLLQGMKFDPLGNYVRAWLPQLTKVPNQYIHCPWSMPEDLQAHCGCRIGKDYPAPIVDHAAARQRALAAYSWSGVNSPE